MLNSYHLFLPYAVPTQAPLHTLLAGPRTKGRNPSTTPELNRAFEECKASRAPPCSLTRTGPPHCPGDRRLDHGHGSSVATKD